MQRAFTVPVRPVCVCVFCVYAAAVIVLRFVKTARLLAEAEAEEGEGSAADATVTIAEVAAGSAANAKDTVETVSREVAVEGGRTEEL